jgi:RNA polymerase sigma-70 factor (ECF subfamily)
MSHTTYRKIAIKELIERARAGDDVALEELFRRSQDILKGLRAERQAMARPDGAGPSDVAQETARRAFEKFSTFKGTTEGEWRVWLRTIFVNCLTELHRNAGRQKRKQKGGDTVSLDGETAAEVRGPEKSPSQAASYNEESRRLLASLYLLDRDAGEAMWLHHMREIPVSEVARLMGKNRPVVIRLLCGGLSALRSIMMNGGDVDSGDAPTLTTSRISRTSRTSRSLSEEASEALSLYLSRRDAGEQVDRERFAAEHPGCADELRALLEWIEHIEAIWRRSSGSS